MNTVLERMERLPIVGILRGFEIRQLPGIVGAARRGGLVNLEVTLNSAGASEQIRAAVELANGAMCIGAGTVTTMERLEEALAAGAQFVVTPSLNMQVLAECVRRSVPIFPGAMSPTEVWAAWEAGAAMVKIFPAELGGPAFLKALRGPFPQVKLMPTGGVDLSTLAEFLKAGASGAGVGSPLFDRARVEAGDWDWLEKRTAAFVAEWKTQRRTMA